AEEGARARAQACPVVEGERGWPGADRQGLRQGSQDEGAARSVRQARFRERVDRRRRRARGGLPVGRAQHPEYRCAAGAGHQRLRHSPPQEARADQGGGRSAGGAVQMSTSDPRHYDVILSPVITEKSTVASEQNKVMFKVAAGATKPQIKEAVEKLFDVKVKSVNTLTRKGKMKAFRGSLGVQSPSKRAIVTLEEGHRIDVTTGL